MYAGVLSRCPACKEWSWHAAQGAFVVTFGRAGEDKKFNKLGDVEATLQGFAGADYDLQVGLCSSHICQYLHMLGTAWSTCWKCLQPCRMADEMHCNRRHLWHTPQTTSNRLSDVNLPVTRCKASSAAVNPRCCISSSLDQHIGSALRLLTALPIQLEGCMSVTICSDFQLPSPRHFGHVLVTQALPFLGRPGRGHRQDKRPT